MEQSISDFLGFLKIPFSKKYVGKLMQAHPDFPSLLSISDILHRLGVNNTVARIAKHQLQEVEFPYLIPLDKGRGDIIVIKHANDLRKNESLLEEWGGAILLAEPAKATSDKTNIELYAKENSIKRNSMVAMFALAVLLMAGIGFNVWQNVITILALGGLAVGYLLFAKDLGINYAAVEAFCNSGKNTNCDRVLKADVTLLGINFSDAVLSYFLFQTMAIALAPFLAAPQSILFTLSVIGFLPVPIVIFSIYYQWFVAKTWCRLCLVVDGILIAQAMLFGYMLYTGTITISISWPLLLPMAMVALLIFLSVVTVKASLERYEKLSQLGADGNRIKHNTAVFTTLLKKQRKINTQPFNAEMQLGNPRAPIKIIMVSNLFCNPCKLKHEVVDQLVATYPQVVHVAMRFVKSGRDVGSVGHLLSYWHQAIYGKENESPNTAKLMHDWFELWDFEKFKKKYPVTADAAQVEKLEAQHYAWIDQAEVRLTPTFFVNGYQLPKEYLIDDLLAMAPSLADSFEKYTVKDKQLQHTDGVPNGQAMN